MTAGQRLVANIQQSPSNPDVTCIRAKVAVQIAKKKLEESKLNLRKALERGYKVEDAKALTLRCQKIYDRAVDLSEKVNMAKKETKDALKKYEEVEKRAKDLERKALLQQERVQVAAEMVKKAEKHEFVVRRCKRRPRKLVKEEKVVVKELEVREEKVLKKLKRLEKVMVVLKGVKSSEKVERKKKVVKRVLKKLRKRLEEYREVVLVLTKAKKKVVKRKLLGVEKGVVGRVEGKVKVLDVKIARLSETVRILKEDVKNSKEKVERDMLNKKVKELVKALRKVRRKRRVLLVTKESLEEKGPKLEELKAELTPAKQKLVTKLEVRIATVKRRVVLMKKKVKKLLRIMPRLNAKKKGIVVRRIAYYKDKSKVEERKLKRMNNVIRLIVKGGEKRVKVRKRTEFEREVLKRLRKRLIQLGKKRRVIKKTISDLESDIDPEKEELNAKQAEEYEKVVKKIEAKMNHLKGSIQKVKEQVEEPVKKRKLTKVERLVIRKLKEQEHTVVKSWREKKVELFKLRKKGVTAGVEALKKAVEQLHVRYIRLKKTIRKVDPLAHVEKEKAVMPKVQHFVHKVFKCEMVAAPPELSGPVAHGKSREENLKELIRKEKEQLVELRKEAMALEGLIKQHEELAIRQEGVE